MTLTPTEFDALTRVDLATFVERAFVELNPTTRYYDNFHVHLIAAELEGMRRGDLRRLIVNVPPRNLKSIIATVAFTAWLLGHDPSCKVICVSYTQELADSHARQCRQIMQSEWYRRLFPKTKLSPSKLAADRFETTVGGFRMATSVEGTLLGFGADYIFIDDPVNPEEALSDTIRTRVNGWYGRGLVTRLDDKRHGRIAIVMQRLHENDLVGHVLSLESWKVIALSAIALASETHIIRTPFGTITHRRKEGEALHPEREPVWLLEDYRRTQGEEVFSAQFLQAPVRPGGNMIKINQFQRFDLDAPPAFEQIVHSWDTANKNTELSGFTVCTIWGMTAGKIYLIDVVRARFEYPELRARSITLSKGSLPASRRPNTILIEDKASGQSLIQDLRREGIYKVVPVKPEADKLTRMHAQTAFIANGAVFVPYAAPWLGEFEHEMVAFPKGKHNDQVDSLSQVLKWFGTWKDEPNLLKYYRDLADAQPRGTNGQGMISMKPLDGSSLVMTPRGHICPDADGVFHVPADTAKSLRISGKWVTV